MQDNTPSSSMYSKYLLRGGSRKETSYSNQQIKHKQGFGLFIRDYSPSYAKGVQRVRGGTGKELEGSMNIISDGTIRMDDVRGQSMWGNNKVAGSDEPVRTSTSQGDHHGAFPCIPD